MYVREGWEANVWRSWSVCRGAASLIPVVIPAKAGRLGARACHFADGRCGIVEGSCALDELL
eukprot:7554119-Prorocentrum_lima.AAC.1